MPKPRDFSRELLVFPQPDQLVLPYNVAADGRLSDLRGDPARLARTDFKHGELPPDLRAVMNAGRWEWLRGLLERCEQRGDPLPWNPPTHFYPRRSLPGNADLVGGEELASLKRRLRKVGRDILTETGYPPFALLDFYDKEECFTTRMLKQVLKDIFGDDYPSLVHDTLRANLNSSDAVKTKVNPATGRPNWLDSFNRTRRNPRVWVMGGTFNDADDVHGEWFQAQVMTPLLEDSNQYVVALCWAYQVMVRALAKQHGLDIFVLNGAARWGAFPVEMKRTPVVQRAFEKDVRGPLTFTAGFTHSDHVVFGPQTPNLGTPVFAPNEYGETVKVLEVVARDSVTGLPAGCLANDGRVALFAFHPEIDLRGEGVEIVKTFIQMKMEGFFEGHYRVNGADMAANFEIPNKMPFSKLGEPFYAALLLHFAEKLLKDVRRS